MSGVLGYALGYDAGRSDAESARETREIADRFIYGQRLVQVDQSYIDRLHDALSAANASSDRNYDSADRFRNEALRWKAKAEQFHGEALYWRGRALPAEADAKALQAQLAERDAALAQAEKAWAAECAVHQTTHEEKCSLDRFRLLATWLANAHIAGRSDRPEFAELLDMVKNAAEAIQRGERFRGYLDTPENEARLDRVVAALDPP